jgi:hypothetical protein
MKYKSPITYHSKDIAKVKDFKKWVKLQDQGHKVKNYVKIFADRQMDRPKTIFPDLSIQGHNKASSIYKSVQL